MHFGGFVKRGPGPLEVFGVRGGCNVDGEMLPLNHCTS